MDAEPASAHTGNEHSFCCYSGCREKVVTGKSLCFWHDPDSPKDSDDICPRLEQMVREGKSLAGFRLARANLENIDLTLRDRKEGADMRHVDLYRANLKGAHLFRANLESSCLMKASLERANLNFARVSGANMLGMNLHQSRMEHVDWGDTLYQELELQQKRKESTLEERQQMYAEAEEVCRNIRKSCETNGLFDEAGTFFEKEMTFRRFQYPLTSWKRWTSKLVDLLCGYGERPFRVFLFSAKLILACALFYSMVGTMSGGEVIRIDSTLSALERFNVLLDALYFSVVTFTTLGYGDITPLGAAKTLAVMEAFVGNFALALFVVVFVKKMTR